MYQLTKEQKLANLEEVKAAKLKKIEVLQQEITGIQKKIDRLKQNPTTTQES